MRTIIAGSRAITNYHAVAEAVVESGFKISEVVSGTASGVDTLGELWATQNAIPIKRFPANWEAFGPRAGMLRNQRMADYANALIAVHDGESPGTANMINEARKRGLQVHVHYADPEPPEPEYY
jgi:hypothetical protein